jgi:hypothetical protein
MKLTELTRRLEGAADELARMRTALSHEAPLKSPGHGPAHELITLVNSAWSSRQTDLATLASHLTELADNVHRAVTRYTATDETAATTTSTALPWNTTTDDSATTTTSTALPWNTTTDDSAIIDRSPATDHSAPADRSAAADGSHRWTP